MVYQTVVRLQGLLAAPLALLSLMVWWLWGVGLVAGVAQSIVPLDLTEVR